jgi:putative ABC transport system substrate-binding protein
MIERRTFIGVLAGGLVALPLLVRAQQATKTHHIGFLRIDRPPQAYIDAFEQGLRDRGYTPGKNILLEFRFADGKSTELPRLADELVSLKVDVIVAGGGQATQAAKNATNTIPIVMIAAGDPVGTGFVATLAHPGGNVTGTSVISWDLIGKRIELLRLVLTKVSQIAVLSNSGNPGPPSAWKEALAAAATLGVSLQHIEVRSARDFDEAFAAMIRGRAEALIVVQDAMFDSAPYRIVQLAASNRLPAVYGPRITVDAGGLMSYGPSVRDLYGHAAVFVDKILKGAKPGDLPVEQPTKIELVINLKTAKALGLTIPQSLLLRADEVLQ